MSGEHRERLLGQSLVITSQWTLRMTKPVRSLTIRASPVARVCAVACMPVLGTLWNRDTLQVYGRVERTREVLPDLGDRVSEIEQAKPLGSRDCGR